MTSQNIIICISALLFILGVVIGSEMPHIDNESQKFIFQFENKCSNNVLFFYFLTNNLRLVGLLISGSALFGAPSCLNLMANGIFIGSTIKSAILTNKLLEFILLTLPHGIFEIPAIIIAGAAGFKIPYEIIRYLAGKKEQILTKEDIREYLTLALISIILIVIAAWIEANVTLKIAKAMLNSTKGI
ncbi:protein of unknown function DUF95 transmembrane [Ferroglobus placidus DSM 10642]|uniref:Stage II sporulation protein M n=1 Tax=Ferroglobus placidus (strain DSM 10642 / AEDII12DO) TaxID=589924 RepID=D3RZW0_FERPA|nr:stage II sporulation protein M [Ferroglobus placidus]ADC66023.1 protein of unknown function DUF95 transmembrane [Ferroglobus placidus DSM 10642]